MYVIEPNASEAAKCQTDGITFPGVWAHSDIVNVNGITTNDVHAMLTTYGVEAARGTLMHEVQSVFAAYGIGVDPRHLSLIADFMTHQVGDCAQPTVPVSQTVMDEVSSHSILLSSEADCTKPVHSDTTHTHPSLEVSHTALRFGNAGWLSHGPVLVILSVQKQRSESDCCI